MSEKDWTKEDERDPFGRFRKKDPRELYEALDHSSASHWCQENPQDMTTETWAKTGNRYQFQLRTRIRPMVESEVILTKVRAHSREAVLKAFGISLEDLYRNQDRPIKKPWWKRLFPFN